MESAGYHLVLVSGPSTVCQFRMKKFLNQMEAQAAKSGQISIF